MSVIVKDDSNKENIKFESKNKNEVSPSTLGDQVTTISENSIKKEIEEISLMKGVAKIIKGIIADKKKIIDKYKKILKLQKDSIYSLEESPEMKIDDYLSRLSDHLKMDKSTVIIMLIYIDRLCDKTKLVLTHLNIHQIAAISAMEAMKYNQDEAYALDFYSNVTGIEVNELIDLEFQFLKSLEFKLFVEKKEYKMYEEYLNTVIKINI